MDIPSPWCPCFSQSPPSTGTTKVPARIKQNGLGLCLLYIGKPRPKGVRFLYEIDWKQFNFRCDVLPCHFGDYAMLLKISYKENRTWYIIISADENPLSLKSTPHIRGKIHFPFIENFEDAHSQFQGSQAAKRRRRRWWSALNDHLFAISSDTHRGGGVCVCCMYRRR